MNDDVLLVEGSRKLMMNDDAFDFFLRPFLDLGGSGVAAAACWSGSKTENSQLKKSRHKSLLSQVLNYF